MLTAAPPPTDRTTVLTMAGNCVDAGTACTTGLSSTACLGLTGLTYSGDLSQTDDSQRESVIRNHI